MLPGVGGALAVAFLDIQAKVDALLAFSASVDIDLSGLAAQIDLAASIGAALATCLALGIQPPSISVQFEIVADLLVGLQANLAILLALQALFLTAGIHAYHYSGRADDMGGEFNTEFAGGLPGGAPSDHIDALVLATSIGATWTAMGQVFKVTP